MEDTVAFAVRVMRPVLRLAPATFLDQTARWLADWGIPQAVAEHDTAIIINWVLSLFAYQGISDVAAARFADRHAPVTWHLLDDELRAGGSCSRLRSHWHFHGCGYRKGVASCAEPDHMETCLVPRLPMRKGSLSQAAVSLYFFVRDVCDGNFVDWIDERLAAADPGKNDLNRSRLLRQAVLEPLCNVVGVGPKVWSMILSDLLLVGDPARERWVTAGASFIAVDSLVHAFLHRTGILARFGATHAYGPACFEANGCAAVIEAIVAAVDARNFNPAFPACFPRFIEKAIWHFSAQGGLNICNARRIDDRAGCRQAFCPAFDTCKRMPFSD